MTFQGHSTSNLRVALDSLYMVSYWCLISNIGPNYTPSRDIRLQNMGDFYFDLSMSLKVSSNSAVGLSIYKFLLMSNSNQGFISHCLGDICTWKFSPYLLPLCQNFAPHPTPGPPLPWADFFQHRITSSMGQREGPHQNEVDWLRAFWDTCILLADRQIHTQTHTQSDRNKLLPVFNKRKPKAIF